MQKVCVMQYCMQLSMMIWKWKKVCPLSVRVLFTDSCILAYKTGMLQTSKSDQQDGNGVLTLGGNYVECPMVWWCSCYHLRFIFQVSPNHLWQDCHTFFYVKCNENDQLAIGFFVHTGIISAVKRLECDTNRLSYIVIWAHCCDVKMSHILVSVRNLSFSISSFNTILKFCYEI